MKQYKITSADFFISGDSGDNDAILSAEDLAEIKSIAGMCQLPIVQNFLNNEKVRSEKKFVPIIKEQKYNG